MPARRINPYLVKRNRSYTVAELAERVGVHKNTVRQWQREGLKVVDGFRPVLFHGETVRKFLVSRNAHRKRPCPPGTFYCFRCREPRQPAFGMADYVELRPGTGNLRAICGACGTIMYRRTRYEALAAMMPGITVRISEAPSRLFGSRSPSLNCESERQGVP